MRKLNILFINESFLPDSIGGSQVISYEIAKYLKRLGHNIYILTANPGKAPPEECIEGMRIFRYRFYGDNLIPSIFSIISTFFKIKKSISLDILHFHHCIPSFIINTLPLPKKIKKISTFYSAWHLEFLVRKGIINFEQKKPLFIGLIANTLKFIQFYSLKKSHKITVLSNYCKDQIQIIYNKDLYNRTEVVYPGIDIDRFKPPEDKILLRDKFNVPKNKLLLLTIRRFIPRMGLENLIEAMHYIRNKNNSLYLFIGGSGPLENKLKDMVEKYQLNDIIKFLGFIDRREIVYYYQMADIFILPTLALESFGLVILEALACGVPVIATPVGGIKEILGRFEPALLCPDTSSRSIAESILKLSSQPEMLRQIQKKCRLFVLNNNFTWENTARKIEKIYKDILC